MLTVLLVAPDAASLADQLVSGLKGGGVITEQATTGDDCLVRATELKPDAIVLDLSTPGVAETRVLETLQDDPVLAEVPVVCIASHFDDGAVQELRRHEYLTRPFDADDLASRVSAALSIKELRDSRRADAERLHVAGRTDAVTGLWNRGHMLEQLRVLTSASSRQGVPLAAVLIGLDHVEHLEESYGAEATDECMRQVADRLRETARIEDVCGRWRDTELLALLPATDLDGAWRMAERSRAAVSERVVRIGEREASITVSGGCASSPRGGDGGSLVRAAERGLRRARETGHNRVCTPPD